MRNTSLVGEVSRTQVMAALALRGKRILVPLGDFQRYDLVFEEEDGQFYRVQAKTGRLAKGAVLFWTCSTDSRSQPGHCIRKPYTHDVEFFGVYCPENNKVYLVPVAEATNTACVLRIDPPRNGQKTRIRWARDFEIGEGVTEGTWVSETTVGPTPG
ncbi:MAG: hypothetical protein HYS12_17855 [Planctomycetes bacterium]|nr:hypothetical protein [Planctomycetota bacterium]